MKIAILGFAGQGKSAFEYWNKDGNEIVIHDAKEDIEAPAGVRTVLGENYLQNLNVYDLVVRTPAIHPNDIVAANYAEILSKTTTVTNEFLKVCPTKNIIGVTGTKGKGTTSTLITKILEAAGKKVHLGGNIGIPPLELLKDIIKPDDWVVLELANFQLIDLKMSPHIGVCLMVAPEHLDWHEDMVEYIQTKSQLFRNQTTSDIAIYNADNEDSQYVVESSKGRKIPYLAPPGALIENEEIKINDQHIVSVSEVKLLGRHNLQNVCAAITAVWQILQDKDAAKKAITEFTGLPHRLELVRELDGIKFFNDSFASAPDATVAALTAITQPKVMIVGGYDRNLDLKHLAEGVVSNSSSVRRVLVIGQSAGRVAEALVEKGYHNYTMVTAKDMSTIVKIAQAEAQAGDAVVLSPGFPSFDMFKNFEDRGLQYKDCVAKL